MQFKTVHDQIPYISSTATNNNFKLPKLNIQLFNGIIHQSFVSLFHNNVNLIYKKFLLIDKPDSIIRYISTSESSYINAWDKLLSRHDKEKQNVSCLIKICLINF